MLYATRHVESEVRRVGFSRHFSDTGGQLAVKAMQGYELIGAACHADIIENALAIFLGREPPGGGAYAVLDDAFCDLESPGPLKAEYIQDHPEEFAMTG